MTPLSDARAQWIADNPKPAGMSQADYDAMADDRAVLLLARQNRILAGQQELADLGFTVAQAKAAYMALKAGAATNGQAQKALAAVLRYLWRELLGD
jgi:hypothetical protein